MTKMRVLVMSVGPASENGTVKYLRKIGGTVEHIIVCLPKQYEHNAPSYDGKATVFIYDEQKYINDDFEFFGLKPRNCGGIGRQGIAEATEMFDNDETVLLQLDDDTQGFGCRKYVGLGKYKNVTIRKWSDLEAIILAEESFFRKTGIYVGCQTAVSFPPENAGFITGKKVFNNFIMRKGNESNFIGFRSLVSDDCRWNLRTNLYEQTPTISHPFMFINFTKNQGDRSDGNAVIYNSDYSWKKSFALKMMMPCAVSQIVKREANRMLFRENIRASELYPPIMLADKNGEVVGTLR